MSNTYIKFCLKKSDLKKTPENISSRFIKTILDQPAPVSNPDFINEIPKIITWLIEFEDDSYFPNREIGLNEMGEPIVAMPWKSNYGYWTDSNVVLKDLASNFAVEQISKVEFAEKWNAFQHKFGKG